MIIHKSDFAFGNLMAMQFKILITFRYHIT